jgi:hypothetical protein
MNNKDDKFNMYEMNYYKLEIKIVIFKLKFKKCNILLQIYNKKLKIFKIEVKKLKRKKLFQIFVVCFLDGSDRDKSNRAIADARDHLDHVNAVYAQVVEFKTSLEKEIATYRQYLESNYLNLIFSFI